MRITWLNKKDLGRVIVFFNGWGMDEKAVTHLQGETDVLEIHDYRILNRELPEGLENYRDIYIIAWSMGVWAAANILPYWNIQVKACIAINGTERPVDDSYGIPVKIFELTEKGMDERGREKFFKRMLNGREEMEKFTCQKPVRPLYEQCEELCTIHRQSTGMQNTISWTKVYIAGTDVIFPTENQLNWWQDKAPLVWLEGGHYPFYRFKYWEEMIRTSEQQTND